MSHRGFTLKRNSLNTLISAYKNVLFSQDGNFNTTAYLKTPAFTPAHVNIGFQHKEFSRG